MNSKWQAKVEIKNGLALVRARTVGEVMARVMKLPLVPGTPIVMAAIHPRSPSLAMVNKAMAGRIPSAVVA